MNFLRKIRQRLLTENRVSKYLLYAVGEIALVVIGILMALQINTWNQTRQEYRASIQYHERLIQDLERFIKQAGNLKDESDRRLRQISQTIDLLETGRLPEEKRDIFQKTFLEFYRFNYINSDLATLEEMKSNGDLGLIYNTGLREAVIEFQWEIASTNHIYQALGTTIQNKLPYVDKYVRTKVDTLNYGIRFEASFRAMAADTEFINNFSRIAIPWRGTAFFNKSLQEKAIALKNRIESELNSMSP